MKTNIVLVATVLFAAISCSKESPVTPTSPIHLRLTAESARTTVGEPDSQGKRAVLWCTGDKVTLNGNSSNALDAAYDGKAEAEFVFPSATSTPYRLLYPSSMYFDESSIVLPAVQDAMPGNDDFASGSVPMAGYSASATGALQMKHLCAAVKIRWKQAAAQTDKDKMLYVEFVGGDGEQLSGKFAIDYSNATLTGLDGGEAAKTVRALSGKAQSQDTCVTNIVIPAGTYTKGFTVRLVDEAGHFMEKTLPAARTFAAGTVYGYPVFEFEPSGTILVIDTKAKLKSWAGGTAYKAAGDKVVLAADIDMAGEAWTPVTFDGDFDGLGHSITNLTVERDGDATFFGTVKGSVKNLSFGSATDASVFRSTKTGTASAYIAPIRNLSGTAYVDNVISYADVEFAGSSTGAMTAAGIIGGFGSTATVSNCIFYGDLKISSALGTASNIGGVIGSILADGTVKSCINRGTLEVANTYSESINFGAIAGYCSLKATISACINEGTIKTSGTADSTGGQTSIGGILGYNNTNPCTITDCINRGTVWKSNVNITRSSYVGGIVGYTNQSTVITNCANESSATVKNTGNNSGKQLSLGGIVGGAYADASAAVITNCVNAGSVINTAYGNRYIGGIIGWDAQGDDSHKPKITACTNAGTISDNITTGVLQLGGIAGTVTYIQAEINGCTGAGNIDVPSARLTTCGALVGIQSAYMISWTVKTGIKVGAHTVTASDLAASTLKANQYLYVRGTNSTGEIMEDVDRSDLGVDSLDQNNDPYNW